ncbi:MAG: AAA family ATPase [Promethearchaeota archaeon]|jgi:dephospho-CoA kinase
MKVIAICGLPGSGKTTAINAIKDLGIVVTMGDIVRREAEKKNIEPSGSNLGKIAKELRDKAGPGIIAKKCVDVIKKLDEDIIIVDGVRSLAEVNVFRNFWKFPIIAIIIDEENRVKRLFERARSDDPKDFDELRERDKREFGFGLNIVLEQAEYKIKNNSSIDDLKEKTKETVLEILKNY